MTDWPAVIDATWPAAGQQRIGPFLCRQSPGGGRRVNAATTADAAAAADIAAVVAAQQAAGQPPLFRVMGHQTALDAALAARGYAHHDATVILTCALDVLTAGGPVPPVTVFTVWPPLASQRDIWAAGDVGPARLAIMDRVQGPKTTLLGRIDDRPAASGFVAMHGTTAMLHALEVAPAYRRRGLARHMTRAAALWAARQGADRFALLVTADNGGAKALYAGLGLVEGGQYHYRSGT